jgi:heme o synthase
MQELLKQPLDLSPILDRVSSYYQLTKPRIIPLLIVTTIASMWLAAEGHPDLMLFLVTVSGGMLAAASAQVMNCIYDRDIDYEMERTRHRPIPAGKITVIQAGVFATILAILSFSILYFGANLLAASLAMGGLVFYVLIYTHLLKRHTTQNIVIGGAAGAFPVLVGWAAVTNSLDLAAWVLFAIVFVWTPPHFWSLCLMINIKDDYAKVGVPMLPVVAGEAATAKQVWYYTLGLVPISLFPVYPLGISGLVYGTIAALLGIIFIDKAGKLLKSPDNKDIAKSTFKYSILYMMLLCIGMAIDSIFIQ